MKAIPIKVSEVMYALATTRAHNLGSLHNSILNGGGNLTGYLGQLAYLEAFPEAKEVDAYSFDVIHGGYKVEIKTKQRTVSPLPNFTGHIAKSSDHQNPDIYCFCSAQEHRYIFILGYLRFKDFWERSEFVRGGESRKGDSFIEQADANVILYNQLNEYKDASISIDDPLIAHPVTGELYNKRTSEFVW